MTVKKEHEFCEADRYHYDWLLCKKGYATIDCAEDASYYGNWVNPETFVLFTYAEGDCYTVTCDTAEEFVEEVNRTCQWMRDNTTFYGIDPGLKESAKQPWIDLGLEELLH